MKPSTTKTIYLPPRWPKELRPRARTWPQSRPRTSTRNSKKSYKMTISSARFPPAGGRSPKTSFRRISQLSPVSGNDMRPGGSWWCRENAESGLSTSSTTLTPQDTLELRKLNVLYKSASAGRASVKTHGTTLDLVFCALAANLFLLVSKSSSVRSVEAEVTDVQSESRKVQPILY